MIVRLLQPKQIARPALLPAAPASVCVVVACPAIVQLFARHIAHDPLDPTRSTSSRTSSRPETGPHAIDARTRAPSETPHPLRGPRAPLCPCASTCPGARSSLASVPRPHRPSLRSASTRYCGFTMRREKNSCSGIAKIDAFSRKKGRRSGYVTSNRWFTCTFGSSVPISLKSGFSARSSVSASCSTAFASRPPVVLRLLLRPQRRIEIVILRIEFHRESSAHCRPAKCPRQSLSAQTVPQTAAASDAR